MNMQIDEDKKSQDYKKKQLLAATGKGFSEIIKNRNQNHHLLGICRCYGYICCGFNSVDKK